MDEHRSVGTRAFRRGGHCHLSVQGRYDPYAPRLLCRRHDASSDGSSFMNRMGIRPKAHSGPNLGSGRNRLIPVLVPALVAATLAHGPATFAQSQDKVTAGLDIWKSSGCADCHGPFADGNPEDGDFPIGANLRTARLDRAGLKQTIRCGRPGTGMPSFDGGAYQAGACNGRPAGSTPEHLQPTPGTLNLA